MSDDTIATQIRKAYQRIDKGTTGIARLADLRAALPGVNRADLDRVLLHLKVDQDAIELYPNDPWGTITDTDRAAAITVGPEQRYYLAFH